MRIHLTQRIPHIIGVKITTPSGGVDTVVYYCVSSIDKIGVSPVVTGTEVVAAIGRPTG